jgi:hypothetical protein
MWQGWAYEVRVLVMVVVAFLPVLALMLVVGVPGWLRFAGGMVFGSWFSWRLRRWS